MMMTNDTKIPASFFFGFFERAKIRMEEYPKDGLKLMNDDDDGFPISLKRHRELLLEEQVLVLKEEVNRYPLSLSFVQNGLRELGQKDTSHIFFQEEEEEERLVKAMEEMNESARLAFARGVLKSEVDWVRHREVQTGSQQMEDIYAHRTLQSSSTADDDHRVIRMIMDFCSLCMAAVKIPAVLHHLYHGTDIFKKQNSTNEEMTTTMMMMHQRLASLQNVYFCALGYHPQLGQSELKRFIHQYIMINNNNNDDHSSNDDTDIIALQRTLQSFISCMQMVSTNYTNQVTKSNDGTTRVVSVSHCEKIIHSTNKGNEEVNASGNGPPIRHSIHQEEQQKEQMEMAKKAASLQQSILSSFQRMSKEERELELEKAKKVHTNFLSTAMKLPPGPERVNYLQSVDQPTQRLLIIHKLYAPPNGP